MDHEIRSKTVKTNKHRQTTTTATKAQQKKVSLWSPHPRRTCFGNLGVAVGPRRAGLQVWVPRASTQTLSFLAESIFVHCRWASRHYWSVGLLIVSLNGRKKRKCRYTRASGKGLLARFRFWGIIKLIALKERRYLNAPGNFWFDCSFSSDAIHHPASCVWESKPKLKRREVELRTPWSFRCDPSSREPSLRAGKSLLWSPHYFPTVQIIPDLSLCKNVDHKYNS